MELSQILKSIQQLSNNDNKFDKQMIMQDIITKNFQALKIILSRISSLYQFNQDLEKNVMNIQMKMNRILQDQQNIHYQMRVNQNSLDQKLNNLSEKYNNLSSIRGNKMKKTIQISQRSIDKTLIAEYAQKEQDKYQQQLRQQNISRVSSSCHEINIDSQSNTKILKNEKKSSVQKLKKRQITFKVQKQMPSSQKTMKNSSNEAISHNSKTNIQQMDQTYNQNKQQNRLKTSLHVIRDDESQTESIAQRYDNFSGEFKSQKNLNRKANLKKTKTYNQVQSNSLTKFIRKDSNKTENNILNLNNDKAQKSLTNILQQVENYNKTNQKIRNNYEQLMQQYCNTNQKNLNLVQNQIKDLTNILNRQKNDNKHLFQELKKYIDTRIQSLQIKYDDIVLKYDNFINKDYFFQFETQCNKRFQALHEQRLNLAKKDETKRALQFIDKKLNKALKTINKNDNLQHSISIHKVQVDKKGCFKISQCNNQQQRLNELKNEQINNSKITQNQNSFRPFHLKRQVQSVYNNEIHGMLSQNRFNEEIGYQDKSLNKSNRQSQELTLRAKTTVQKDRKKQMLNDLNKKSREILSKEKVKIKRIKQNPSMIFQYD